VGAGLVGGDLADLVGLVLVGIKRPMATTIRPTMNGFIRPMTWSSRADSEQDHDHGAGELRDELTHQRSPHDSCHSSSSCPTCSSR